ncbi:MAG: heparinase II/III family protein [Methylacidiphilales bacterium]|nr:heparinase II/III family protein [Candidatus Methylacidiphilales bacterium]
MHFTLPARCRVLPLLAGGFILAGISIGKGQAAATVPLKPLYPGVPALGEADFFSALNPNYPGLGEVIAAAKAGDYEKAKQAYLAFRRRSDAPRYFISAADKPAAPTESDDSAGDIAADNEFSVFDMISKQYAPNGRVRYPDPINWISNPVPKSDPAYNAEFQISVNRHGIWGALGSAYWKTGNEKYAQAWARQFMSWIEQCPQPMALDEFAKKVPQIIPWRTLDTAIRLGESWPGAYAHFEFSPVMTPDVNFDYARSFLQQGRWLSAGLENHPERDGNWVVAEASGLFTMATLFPEFTESDHLRQVAFGRLDTELQHSVYPDGAEIELTNHYHEGTRRSFALALRLAKLNNQPVDPDFMARLKTMYDFEAAMIDQHGGVPMLNDGLPENWVKPLTEGTALWPDDAQMKFAATLGKEGTAPPLSSLLPYAGYALMRDTWAPDGMTLTFQGGPIGSGHWHEDGLSIDLSVNGKDILTEAGHYTYDHSKWRYYAISTEGHSTIMVDGKGQHRGLRYSKPAMPRVKAGVSWMTSDVIDFAASTYDKGYAQEFLTTTQGFPIGWKEPSDFSITHTRQIFFLKPRAFLVLDFLTGAGTHRYDAYFHLDAPNASLAKDTLIAASQNTDRNNLALVPLDRAGLTARVVKGQQDPPLGWIPMEHRPIPVVIYTKTQAAPATFATLLVPFGTTVPEVVATSLDGGGNFWARTVKLMGETDEIFSRVSGMGELKAGQSKLQPDLSATGQAFVVRQPADGSGVSVAGYGVTQFGTAGGLWTISPAGNIVATRAKKEEKLQLENVGDQPLTLTPTLGGAPVQLAPHAMLN